MTSESLVIDGEGLQGMPVSRIGAKAANLCRLVRAGVEVPDFFVLATEAFDRHVEPMAAEIDRALEGLDKDDFAAIERAGREIRERIESRKLDDALKAAVLKTFDKIFFTMPDQTFVSVRSSAQDEDSPEFSFAGQYDSYLFVKGDNGLFDAIRKVFASAYTARSISYRLQRDRGLKGGGVAVIVQKMIFGEVSGVLFTANVLRRDPEQTLITAAYGIGEGVVSGAVDTDLWTLDVGGRVSESTIARKGFQIAWDEEKGTGTRQVPVEPEMQEKPCLDKAMIGRLFRTGRKIEEARDHVPQDIEWTAKGETLYILQTRPITTLGHVRKGGKKTIWDNSNIVESFSGVTSPLTFSVASRAYDTVYRQVLGVLGVPARRLESMAYTFRNLLGFIRGRIYYNLNSWHDCLQTLPGYDFNREFMDQMMGVKEKADVEEDVPEIGPFRRYFVELPPMVWALVNIIAKYFMLPKLAKDFQADFDRNYERFEVMDMDAKTPSHLLADYEDLLDNVLTRWKAPIINDFFTMIFYGVLKKLIQSWGLDENASLQNDLLCGQGRMASTEPTRRIMEIANKVQDDAALKEYLLEHGEERIMTEVFGGEVPDLLAPFRKDLDAYLKAYGFRCMNELKLEEKSLRDDPRFLVSIVRNYIRAEKIDLDAMEGREKRVRIEAERAVAERLAGRRAFGPITRAGLFRWVAEKTRWHVKLREELRFDRTKIFGTVRRIFNAMGGIFARRGILDEAADIYMLTVDEVFGFVEGRATTIDLKSLTELRRREIEAFRAEEDPPERVITYGEACDGDFFPAYTEEAVVPEDAEPGTFYGTPCSPGEIEGEVRVILHPSEGLSLDGQILVAKSTDPGWVPIFPSISGLIIERGSVLSHSAVVAREMSIPTVVGVRGIASELKSGQRVALDGSKGTIRMIEELG